MNIKIVDWRKLGVVIMRDAGLYLNPGSGNWDKTFSAAKHVTPFTYFDATVPQFKNVQIVDIGSTLIQYCDASALIVTLDAAGQVLDTVDIWTLPNPVPNPTLGGFSRS